MSSVATQGFRSGTVIEKAIEECKTQHGIESRNEALEYICQAFHERDSRSVPESDI